MKTKSKEKQEKPLISESWWSRNVIAFIITSMVVLATFLIAVHALLLNKTPNYDFVGQSLLPLWGTWIGTVLAFYFGKANFEAATKSYQEAMKSQTPEDKYAQQAVKNVMLPMKDIIYLTYDDKQLNTPIAEILKYPQFAPYNRFSVLDAGKVVKFMIHRGLFYQFIYARTTEPAPDGTTADGTKLTLKDLLDSTDERFQNPLKRGIVFINVDANLLDAKHKMDAVEECYDVFVTQNGKPTEPVLGLITNNRLLEYSKM